MREILHAVAMVLVLAVAGLCLLVQVSDVNRALDRISHDDRAVVQQVSSETGGAPHVPHGTRTTQHAGR